MDFITNLVIWCLRHSHNRSESGCKQLDCFPWCLNKLSETVCVQCIDRFPVILHIFRVRQVKEDILNVGSREMGLSLSLFLACCSCCLYLELSVSHLQIVRMLSATASIANQACFDPNGSRMFSCGFVHYRPCFSRTFRLADFLVLSSSDIVNNAGLQQIEP